MEQLFDEQKEGANSGRDTLPIDNAFDIGSATETEGLRNRDERNASFVQNFHEQAGASHIFAFLEDGRVIIITPERVFDAHYLSGQLFSMVRYQYLRTQAQFRPTPAIDLHESEMACPAGEQDGNEADPFMQYADWLLTGQYIGNIAKVSVLPVSKIRELCVDIEKTRVSRVVDFWIPGNLKFSYGEVEIIDLTSLPRFVRYWYRNDQFCYSDMPEQR